MNEGEKCDLGKRDITYLTRFMQKVGDYSKVLHSLGDRWEMLTLLGQMSGTGTEMSKTKDGFALLSGKLIENLAKETVNKLSGEINSKAQVAVDILIRNLFERTADIGFLATDEDVRKLLLPDEFGNSIVSKKYKTESPRDFTSEIEALQERFKEYVEKYSVYFDIVLFDTKGKVLVRLDDCKANQTVLKSSHALIRQAINCSGDYVETLDKVDFLPKRDIALIYSYKVRESNESSKVIGVLSLCFKFEDEMERIFSKLRDGNDWLVLSILDKNGFVIASSDTDQIRIGAKLEKAVNEDFRITKFAGRNYFTTTCETKGYQGYYGLGWCGHAMIGLEQAFDFDNSEALSVVDNNILSSVMSSPTLFSKDLREIPVQAELIQKELERTVWNGNVKQTSSKKNQSVSFSKALLWEISATGAKTKDVFASSIDNLHETVVSSILADALFQSSLAIDIMDRNLYERANDCRWWALNSTFRKILSEKDMFDLDQNIASSILSYINTLYTVYTNLFLFDRNGKIVAMSNEDDSIMVGRVLDSEYIKLALSNKNTAKYAVSNYAKTPLYGNRETYIYAASILSGDGSGEYGESVVGGIGIVFDSEPQFEAMLSDALPKDEKGHPLPKCFGIFADKNRIVISSTEPRYIVGEKLVNIDDNFFRLANGEGYSNIILFDGSYYAVGSRCSGGYREYKSVSDDYKNDIVALIFVYLGDALNEDQRLSGQKDKEGKRISIGGERSSVRNENEDSMEIATFYIANKWLGVEASNVLEAISVKGLTTVPGANKMLLGRTNYNGRTIDVVCLRGELGLEHKDIQDDDQIVVVKLESSENLPKQYGILVDALGEIPEVPLHRIDKLDSLVGGTELLGEAIVKAESGKQTEREMLVVIDPSKVIYKLIRRS